MKSKNPFRELVNKLQQIRKESLTQRTDQQSQHNTKKTKSRELNDSVVLVLGYLFLKTMNSRVLFLRPLKKSDMLQNIIPAILALSARPQSLDEFEFEQTS